MRSAHLSVPSAPSRTARSASQRAGLSTQSSSSSSSTRLHTPPAAAPGGNGTAIGGAKTDPRCGSLAFLLSRLLPGWLNGGGRSSQADTDTTQEGSMARLTPRAYQTELVQLTQHTNAIVTLPTGAGKTLIAAELIIRRLPQLKAGGKAAVFLCPTNPLVDQQARVTLAERHGLVSKAFHGDSGAASISTWDRARWQAELAALDVVVMTPELLLHCLAHASLKMADIGLLVFDEAHHCTGDHPYSQLMEDFYHTAPLQARPQIFGLTASPVGVEGLLLPAGKNKNKKRATGEAVRLGLQHTLNARLVTLQPEHRSELAATVPVPANETVSYADTDPAWINDPALLAARATLHDAVEGLLVPAKRCGDVLEKLARQAMLAESGAMPAHPMLLTAFAGSRQGGPRYASMSVLHKQVNGARHCLGALGPWGTAVAAHLDLLSAAPGREDDDDDAASDTSDSPSEGIDEEVDAADTGAAAAAAAACAGLGIAGMAYLEIAKLMSDDDVGTAPDGLLATLRTDCLSIHSWLRRCDPAVLGPGALPAAVPSDPAGLAALAPQLLALASQAAVLSVLKVLADLLVCDRASRAAWMNDAGLRTAAASPDRRGGGALQHYSAQLLQQVPFDALQAQIWPHLRPAEPWPDSMPPLLSPKVVSVARLLADKHAQAGGGEWAAVVFVQTKLTALVLHKLLASCPGMSASLRSGYLVGDTEYGGGTAALGMSHSAQRRVVDVFRRGDLNVLVSTDVGVEGMDFRQCQVVVSYEYPSNVTSYIQARGRARAAGSRHCWLVPEGPECHKVLPHKDKLIAEAKTLEDHAAAVSADTRRLLAQYGGRPPLLRATQEAHPALHLVTPQGAVATLRLSQCILAGFCAKLPGSDRSCTLQAYYQTTAAPDPRTFRTTIYLPSNAGVAGAVTGPTASPSLNSKAAKKAAKNAAALAVLRVLYAGARLNAFLQPAWVSNRHSRQLEAEPVPPFTYSAQLQPALAPRSITVGPNSNLTLHLHSFTSWQPQQQQASSSVLDTLSLVVGTKARCRAVPGSSGDVGQPGSSSSSSRFGVLTWDSLPGAYSTAAGAAAAGGVPLRFPAWRSPDQQEPEEVAVLYEGAVQLSASELLRLMRCGAVLNNLVNWSGNKLLGITAAQHEQFGGAFKPLQPAAFADRAGFTAAAAAAGLSDAAAAEALQGASLALLLVPVQQQQQHGAASCSLDWAAVQNAASGLTPAAAVITGEQHGQAAAGGHAGAAAAAPVPAAVSSSSVVAAQHLLQDRVLLAGHSSQLYRCLGVAASTTPATEMAFQWQQAPEGAGSSSDGQVCTASSHAAYYHQRYGVSGLRPDLPMLAVSKSGRGNALQLISNPLKPPELQTRRSAAPGESSGARPRDLTTPEAASAAGEFTTLAGAGAAASNAGPDSKRRRLSGEPEGASPPPSEGDRFLPLELCWCLPLSAAAWREAALLPAYMYRVNSLLRLRQLQQHLQDSFGIDTSSTSSTSGGAAGAALSIHPALLMAAVTGSNPREAFDMEGLEFLGDVVLKFLAANHLLQKHDDWNEGQLSVEKARLVRNVQLAATAHSTPGLSLQRFLHLLPFSQSLYTPTGALAGSGAVPLGLLSEPQQRPFQGKRLADCVEALVGGCYLTAAADAAAAAGAGGPGVSCAAPVSQPGLEAAARFCVLTGILPPDAAAAASKPPAAGSSAAASSGKQRQDVAALQRSLQPLLGRSFTQPALLLQALTHVSHSSGQLSYQLAEFLGDAVLDLFASSWLMLRLAAAAADSDVRVYAPAELTWRRGALVNNTNLARVAVAAGLQHHIKAHSRALMGGVRRFAGHQHPAAGSQQQQQQEQQEQQEQEQEQQEAGQPSSSQGGSPLMRLAKRAMGAVVAATAAAAVVEGAPTRASPAQLLRSRWSPADAEVWQRVWVEQADSCVDEGDDEAGARTQQQQPRAPKVLADVVEALVGASLVDASAGRGALEWGSTWAVVQRLMPGLRS